MSTNPHKGRAGRDRIVHAAMNSLRGLQAALREESAFRQECAMAVVLVPAAFWLGRDWVATALLAGSVLLVLVVELLNSALETAADAVTTQQHPLIKRAKDMASAAVTMSLVLALLTWAVVFWR